jgi:hypothetical protein
MVRVHTEDIGVDWKVTRKLILKKQDVSVESAGSEYRPVGGE